MVQTDRIKTVAIVGCTAVGKSAVALKLAKHFDGELIGADSMQIYRGFDIGTGKLTKSECDGIEHHLIDIVDGDADFSVGEYVKYADRAIRSVTVSGKLPIVVGGTGLYVNSLFSGCDFAETSKNDELRRALKILAHFFGGNALHALLEKVDERAAANISSNDVKRVTRALEIYSLTGKPKTVAARRELPPYNYLTIVLTLPRDILYERINARVKQMFDDGLIDEVRGLARYKNCGSMQAIGYKQIISAENMSREELEPLVAQKTRNYAKRQMTYFNHMKIDKIFIDARNYNEIETSVEKFLNGSNNE